MGEEREEGDILLGSRHMDGAEPGGGDGVMLPANLRCSMAFSVSRSRMRDDSRRTRGSKLHCSSARI